MGDNGNYSGKDKAYYDDLVNKIKSEKSVNDSAPLPNQSFNSVNSPAQEKFNVNPWMGFAGVILLIIGVFSPLISIPIIGNRNFFQNGEGDGMIILGAAVVSLIIIFTKNFKALWIPGLVSFGLMIFTYINIKWRLHNLIEDMDAQLAANPYRGIADVAVQSIQIQWGWAVLVAGSVLVLLAAAIKEK